jgi:hypothetical protein
MPHLPFDPQAKWPPLALAKQTRKWDEWSAWYSGDPERLKDAYAGAPVSGARPWYRFWHRIGNEPQAQKAQLHVPVAGDLAAVSGSLLFGEAPAIRVKEAHSAGRGAPAAKRAEARLQEIVEESGTYSRLIEAAETAAAMGGVYLVPVWDKELADFPIPAVVQADQAVPEFKHGILRSVILWRVVEENGNVITRHLELHMPAMAGGETATIVNALYRGNKTDIGERLSDETVQLTLGVEPVVRLPFPGLDVEYVPNMRPNRLWRNSGLGLSDFSGAEGMFDSLDETYASWMRDIRLAKARIIVPRDFIDEQGAVDIDHEVYQPMDMEPGAAELGARSMLAQQFAIRYLEHRETSIELVERIVSNAGYSPQTFGIRIEGRAESGSALRVRERKTILTLKRKASWWVPAIASLFGHILELDRAVFSGPGLGANTIEVETNDGIPVDMADLAQTAAALRGARAASTETLVRLVNPHWDIEKVAAEVARIEKEEEAAAKAAAPPPGTQAGGAENEPASDEGMTIATDQSTGETRVRRSRSANS